MDTIKLWARNGDAVRQAIEWVHDLGLLDDQVKQLTPIFFQTTKARIKQRADIRIAELELGELLEADPVDMGQVEGKLKAMEGLRTRLRLSLIQAHEQAKGILTPEQPQKLERLHDRLPGMTGPGMMSMIEMMGEAGSGGMGMMGPQMMQQMMGGSMGGQPLPWTGYLLPRRWAPLAHIARDEREPPLRPDSPSQ